MAEALEPITMPSLVGEEVDNWKIVSTLGEGGMSVVYLGEHKWLDQRAAIKLLRPEFCRDAAVLGRFQQEALAASRLQHQNIIQVSNFGRDPKHGYFMVLEYLEGVELELIIEDAPLPKGWILPIVKQVCSALHTTHQAQIIHRDMKPSNIFLLPGSDNIPQVKLLDFGIAKVHFEATSQKLTSTGVIVGTPAYLAPEQVVPRHGLTHAADIYSIGVVIFQMFTGQLPLFAESTIEHVIKVLQVEAPLAGTLRPELSGTPLEAFLARMLQKKPENRPLSMKAVWEEFREAAAEWDDPLDQPFRYPNLATFMTEEAIARRKEQQVAVQTSAFETGGRLQLGDQGVLPTGNAVVGSGPAVGQATSGWDTSGEFATPEDPGADGAPRRGLALSIAMASLVLVLLAVLAYFAWPKETTAPTNKRATAAPKPKVDRLKFLVFNGIKSLEKKKVKQAIALMRKAMKDKRFKKSRYSALVYSSMGKALKERKQLYSAIQYVDRYLAALQSIRKRRDQLNEQLQAANKAGREKEAAKLRDALARLVASIPQEDQLKSQMKAFSSWRRALKERTTVSKGLLHKLQTQLKRRQYKKAHRTFKEIQALAPSHPKVLKSLASAVAKQFPHIADRLMSTIVEELDVTSTFKDKVDRQHVPVKKRLSQSRQVIAQALRQASAAIAAKKWRRALRALNKGIKRESFMQSHQQIRSWLDGLRATQPSAAARLWGWYIQRWRQLERRGLGAWVDGDSRAVTTKVLREQQRVLQQVARIKRTWGQLKAAMAKGQVSQAESLNKRLLAMTTKLNATDKWKFRKPIEGLKKEAVALKPRLKQASTWIRRARQLTAQAKFGEAKEAQKKALQALKGSDALLRWIKAFRRDKSRMESAIKHRKRAQYRTLQLRWREAEKQFKAYLKLYPKAHDRKDVERKIKLCRCGYIQGSWEVCPTRDSKALLRHMRRKR